MKITAVETSARPRRMTERARSRRSAPSCGAALDARAVGGHCPRCLVSLGLSSRSIEVGSRLGDYHVLGLLGRGGMGEVYRARDSRLGREVAIKLLGPELDARADMLARFEREARVLASLNHPNIATLYGFESDGERRFLVMELVSGESLEQRLARGALPRLEALRVFRDVAHGLAAAHDRGVVHRDLKPSNIALASSGAVKVLDFGLAKPGIDARSASLVPVDLADPGARRDWRRRAGRHRRLHEPGAGQGP